MRYAAVALALVTAGACRGGPKQHREGSAAAVEVVTEPIDAKTERGSASDEIEPNDGDDVATPLPLGGTVRGKIDPDADVDHYRIDVTAAGALSVMVSAVDVDLVLEIEDGSGTVIAKSDRGAARTREGVPNLGVTPGRYTAVVSKKKPAKPKPAKGPAKAEPPAPAYEITASVAPFTTKAEREPDDDRGTANDLIVGDTATGFLGWTGDADVWKLSTEMLSAKNAVDLEISAVEGVVLQLEIDDALGQPLATRKSPRGAPLVIRGLQPPLAAGSPPYAYLTLKGDRSNPETPYQLHATATVIETDAEIEPNDTPDKAMPFPPDRTSVKATWSPGDVDCFAIAPVDSARTIEATVDTPAEVDLAAELVVEGKTIAKVDHPGKGAAEKVAGKVPANAHVVVCVRGSSTTGEGAYKLTIAETPGP